LPHRCHHAADVGWSVMFVTRRVNWYDMKVGGREASA
jgi:hypothetical protein